LACCVVHHSVLESLADLFADDRLIESVIGATQASVTSISLMAAKSPAFAPR